MFLNNRHSNDENYKISGHEKTLAWHLMIVLRSRFLGSLLPDHRLAVQPPESTVLNTTNSFWTLINDKDNRPEDPHHVFGYVVARKFIDEANAILEDYFSRDDKIKEDLILLNEVKKDHRAELLNLGGTYVERFHKLYTKNDVSLPVLIKEWDIKDAYFLD